MTNSAELYTRACKSIPGGVNSPVRAWRAVGGAPRFIARAEGCKVYDVDGRAYIDFVNSWGALVAGHAHPRVVARLQEAASRGTTYGAPTENEVKLAEEIRRRFPSVEKLRLVSSGTEATMSALRLARAWTRRDLIVKFDGCYHGHADGLLVRAGSGVATLSLPDSPGVPPAVAQQTLVAKFNDIGSVEELLARHRGRIAAAIVEPVCGNMGVVPPRNGFLEKLRALTQAEGALLIFDEVITGFRLARGGAQELYGLSADLTCLGKIAGGGLPLAAFGGRAELMDLLAPEGPVYQAGTLSGNPLAVTAGLATLEILAEPGAYERLEQSARRLADGLAEALARRRLRGAVNRVGSMLTLFFGVERVEDIDQARKADTAMFARFFHGMLDRGVYFPPSQFEAAFVSLAHAPRDIEETVAAFDDWAGRVTI
ncbi:MAG TPA: glutamate-1-semialdehyde 2,1-aminomutase [Candidatus Acidoferrales bacterium]|nr:glutamate-1-semialdehyde 2,1-aminomutase [Candidatus Acidoferrales bacterium]